MIQMGGNMMTKAALQLYSVRDLMQEDPLKTLEETAKAGYDGVEFAGFFDIPAETMKAKLDEVGLEVCGSHTALELMEKDFDAVLDYNEIIGNNLIIIPYIDPELRTKDYYIELAEKMNDYAKRCKARGFTLAYHNHDFEFKIFDGVTGYDMLIEGTDPQLVKFQVDMGWVSYSGLDTQDFIEKYGHRIIDIHVKQFKEVGSKEGTEVDRGMVDYKPIIKAYQDLGVEWFIVEQENFDIPMLESIGISCQALKAMFI